MKIMAVIDDPPVTNTNGFTVGRAYVVVNRNERGSLTVINDNGHARSLLLDTPSPHLVWDNGKLGFGNVQRPVGHFEEVLG